MTIKPLVELLDVKRKKRALPTVSEEIHSRVRHGSTYSEVLQYVKGIQYTVHCICIITVVWCIPLVISQAIH